MSNLYLFDIDGTLVDLTDIHVNSYMEAYQEVFGPKAEEITKKEIISTFGMPECKQHEQIFQSHNFGNEGQIEQIIKIYENHFINKIKSITINPLPGVIDFLEYLKEHNEYIGIVSGNPDYKGNQILKKAGLYNYFSIFSYDKGFNNRTEIVYEAVKYARKKDYQFEKAIVIGDTTKDIEAGNNAGAVTVAVASGTDSREVLKRANPNVIVDSLEQYLEILRDVNNKID